MYKIRIHDVVHSQIVKGDLDVVRPILSYKKSFSRWSKRQGRRISQEYLKSLIDKKGHFPTGLLPRVLEHLKSKGLKYQVLGKEEKLLPDSEPKLKGKILRDDQIELFHSFTRIGRGIIISPTGTGKTLVVGAIFSCYRKAKKLWLCHTRTLLRQALNDFQNYGLKNITTATEGQVDLSGDIVLATRQTFVNIDPEVYADMFDVVMVDEVHHIPDESAEHSRILNNLLAPVRGGVTATYPGGRSARLAIEGAIGRVVGEFTLKEAIRKGILAKPKVRILRTRVYTDIKELRKYQEVIDQGIVNNEDRNDIIIREAKRQIDRGKSVLILVIRVDHGLNLLKFAKEYKLGIPFIYSKTESAERERLRFAINEKKIMGAIATAVWKEGVNIPTLDTIILAHMGLKELPLLQSVGRGMRKTKDKDIFTIIDIFDPSHQYLIKHFGYRLSYYCERGWL